MRHEPSGTGMIPHKARRLLREQAATNHRRCTLSAPPRWPDQPFVQPAEFLTQTQTDQFVRVALALPAQDLAEQRLRPRCRLVMLHTFVGRPASADLTSSSQTVKTDRKCIKGRIPWVCVSNASGFYVKWKYPRFCVLFFRRRYSPNFYGRMSAK